ncbi:MAG: hypothetical protein ABSE59_02015 [Opitutaceae bacterium]|jgi:hypothetical protein
MFDRLILHHYDAIFGLVAFAVALTVFVLMVWQGLRLPRSKSDKLAHLPFDSPTASRHDHDPTAS